jgi:hypothetical protein
MRTRLPLGADASVQAPEGLNYALAKSRRSWRLNWIDCKLHGVIEAVVAKVGLLSSGTVHASLPNTGGREKVKSSWLSQL